MAQDWKAYKRWAAVAAAATVTGTLWFARQSRIVAAEDHAALVDSWAQRHYVAGLKGDEGPEVGTNAWRVGLAPAWDPSSTNAAGIYKTLKAIRAEALRGNPVWLDPDTEPPEDGGWFVEPTGTVWVVDGDWYKMQTPTAGVERVAGAGSVYGGSAWRGTGGSTMADSVFPVLRLFMHESTAGIGALDETYWKRATGETNHYRWRCELADGTARIPAAVNLAQGFGVVTGLVRTLRICGASYTQEVVRTWATNSGESVTWVYGDPPEDASDSGWAAAQLEQPEASVTVTNGGGALSGARVLAGAVVRAESTTDYMEDYGGPGQGAYSQSRTAAADLSSRGYYGCTVDYPGTWALTNGYVRRVRVYALVYERRLEAEDVAWSGATARTGSAGPAWRPGDFAPGWACVAHGEPCPHDPGYTLARQPVLEGVDAGGFAARGSLVYDGVGAPEFDLPETAAFGMTQPSQALHRLPQSHPYAGWIRIARMKYSREVLLKGFAVVVDWNFDDEAWTEEEGGIE